MAQNKTRKVSQTFVVFIFLFLLLLGYFCYQVVLQTGLIHPTSKDSAAIEVVQIDTNQLKLDQKDSVISTLNDQILSLQHKLELKPDTIFVPKYIRKPDSIPSKQISTVKKDTI